MASNLSLACTVCASLAFLCGIASLATTSWINGCVLFEAIIEAMKYLVDSQTFESIEQRFSQFKKSTFCYNSGIFRVSAEMPAYHASKSIQFTPNPQDRFLHAVGGLLICAIILFGVALILLRASANSRDSLNYERKITAKSCGRIAVGLLLLGSIFYGAGIVTYTINQSKVIHNYQEYMTQIGPSFYAVYNSMPGITGHGGNNLPDKFDRKQRQANFNESTIPLFGQQDYKSNVLSLRNQNDSLGISNKAWEAFNKMNPVFGCSYYIAWIGLAFAIFALVLGALDCGFNSSLNFESQSIAVLKA